jgi:hypothetical protein
MSEKKKETHVKNGRAKQNLLTGDKQLLIHTTQQQHNEVLSLCLRTLLILKGFNDVCLLIGLLLNHHRVRFPT